MESDREKVFEMAITNGVWTTKTTNPQLKCTCDSNCEKHRPATWPNYK